MPNSMTTRKTSGTAASRISDKETLFEKQSATLPMNIMGMMMIFPLSMEATQESVPASCVEREISPPVPMRPISSKVMV